MSERLQDFEFDGPVGIVGSGRMAKALGALLSRRGVSVAAVGARCANAAEAAKQFVGAEHAVPVRELPQHARLIVVAVTDSAIAAVAGELAESGLNDGIVLHTSGAAGPDALEPLRPAGNSVGVMHPLQTVPCAERGVEALAAATYAFAGDARATAWASHLIARVGRKGLPVDPKFWRHYHAGAVMACNYQVTLIEAALELMEIAGIGRGAALDALGPIVRETTASILRLRPEKALTGPIRRGDAGTILRHLTALDDAAPETEHLYRAAGLRTIGLAERAGLEASAAREIETILRTKST